MLAFTATGISSDPSIVQFQKATLEFFAIPEKITAAGGTITLTAPQSVRVHTQELTCLDVLRNKECKVSATAQTLTVTTVDELPAGQQFQYRISNAIDNPSSSQPTDSWQILASSGESQDQGTILTATPGKIQLFQITPASNLVGASTTVDMSWRSQNAVPQGSFYQIKFPIWNQKNLRLNAQKTYLQGSISCVALTVLSPDLSCVFQKDTLTIIGAVSEDLSPNTEVSIRVTGFKNPIDTGIVDGFQVISAQQYQGVFYAIDRGICTLQVTEYARISQGKLEVRNADSEQAGMIQRAEEMKLSFYLPVPLNEGCQVTVELPQQYSVMTVTAVTSLGAFGSIRVFTAKKQTLWLDTKKNSFMIEACESYKENDNLAILYIDQLIHPRYERMTDSLKITIQTAQGRKVAMADSDIGFMPTRGNIAINATAIVPIVQTQTAIDFELYPQHLIFQSDNPWVIITFPAIVPIIGETCTVSAQNYTQATCEKVGQTKTIKNLIAQDYKADGTPIKFTVGVVINQLSTAQVDGLQIVILGDGKYPIDDFDGFTPWQLQPGTFELAQVDPGSYVAYRAENEYKIAMRPKNQVPQNGKFMIQIPASVVIPDISFSQSSCKAISGFQSEFLTCQFEQYQEGQTHYSLQILNAFRRVEGVKNATYVIAVPGIKNPISTKPTAEFKFTTLTGDGYQIDHFEGANIQMLQSAEIQDVDLIASSYINSMRATFTFSMLPSVPLTSTSLVLITFPSQMQLPATEAELNCQATLLITQATCSFDSRQQALPQTVMVRITFEQSQINEFDQFGFSIAGIRNPPSTQPTDSVQIRIVDDKNFNLLNQKLFGVTMTTNQPWSISKAAATTTIQPESFQPGIPTTYQLDFYPEHSIQSKGGLVITVPAQIDLNKNAVTIEVNITGRAVDQQQLNYYVRESARAIYIENLIQGAGDFQPGPDRVIQVKIGGLSTPFTIEPTDSFKVSSFNLVNEQFFYFVDQVSDGLFIKSNCSYPCNTCSADDPNLCLSCFESIVSQRTGLPYLQLGTCVSECNFGRFYNLQTKKCEMCSSQCQQCADSADRCTICGGNDYPYFFEDQCLNVCPSGYISDIAANKCQKCLNNCLTCNNTVTTCTSCDKQGLFPFLFDNECQQSCKKDVSVQVGDECVQCDHTCATCRLTPTTCTSCHQHMRFDPLNNVCTAECQPDTQIYNPDLEQCDTCNDTCTTCQGDINKCTACKPGYVLNKDYSCQRTCNSANQTPVNNICETCDEPCYSCNQTVDSCTSCIQEPTKYFLLNRHQCVQYCPIKYQVDSLNLTCEYVGLICAATYTKDETGNNCIPIYYECARGFELNEDLTACVPEPGSPVPFPFLIAAIFVSFLVLGSYLKEKFFTKVYTCLISIIGSFEVIMYLLMVGISAKQGEWAIFALSSVGLTSILIANLTFCYFYNKEIVSKDQIFSKWLYFYPKTKRLIPIVCFCLNFKCSKIIYSGFYGLESSMAKFGRPLEYYRIVRMCSYFSFIFAYGFVFIADLIIFARIKWGSQLLILGIETCLLQILIIVLTYLEQKKPPTELLSVGSSQYTSINPRKIRGEVKVKSVAGEMESDDYQEGLPDVDEIDMIRSKEQHYRLEANLRMIAFSKIIKQVQFNCQEEDGSNLLGLMTKFNRRKLQERLCMSQDCESVESWSASGESDIEKPACSTKTNERTKKRRYSWPQLYKDSEGICVEKFKAQINSIIESKDDYLIDNCITDVKRVVPKEIRKTKKLVSRRTQTYLKDLLQLTGKDLDFISENSLILDDDAEVDQTLAQNIIKIVIDNVSGNEDEQDFVDEIYAESFERIECQKVEDNQQLVDIMGDFEIDDLGNFILIRVVDEQQHLLDRRGRRVNRRGYLIDRYGNVINTLGNVVYRALELDSDDEIPMPFDHEVQRSLEIVKDKPQIMQEIEKNKDMFDDQTQVKEENYGNQEIKATSKDPENLEIIIQEVTQQRKPKIKRHKRDKKIPFTVVDNYPPKRLKPENTPQLYPSMNIDTQEQRRLAMIVDNISTVTQKLAIDNNKRAVESQSDLMSQKMKQGSIAQDLDQFMYSYERIQSRPQSSISGAQLQYRSKTRPMTGNVNLSQRLQAKSRQNLVSAAKRNERSSLQRVYNNLEQLSNFEETLQKDQQTRLTANRRSIGNELNKIQEIYLNKQIAPPNPKHQAMAYKPFRPTLQKFEDEPSELNVDTVMDGVRYGASQGKDVSLVMADRLDQIQRSYINQSNSLTRHSNLQPTVMTLPLRAVPNSSVSTLSEIRLGNTTQLSINRNRQQDNWIQ